MNMNGNLLTNVERAAHILKAFEPDIQKGGIGSGPHKHESLSDEHKQQLERMYKRYTKQLDKPDNKGDKAASKVLNEMRKILPDYKDLRAYISSKAGTDFNV